MSHDGALRIFAEWFCLARQNPIGKSKLSTRVGRPDSCSLVCSSWRQLAVDTVHSIELQQTDADGLQLWLKRHGHKGLRVLKVHDAAAGPFCSLPCGPKLQQLHLKACCLQLGLDSTLQADLADATGLTSLRLQHITTLFGLLAPGQDSDCQQPQSRSSAEASRSGWRCLVDAVAALPGLQDLAICHMSHDGYYSRLPLPGDLLQRIAPSITHLSLAGSRSDKLLEHLPCLAPSLQHLELNGSGSDLQDSLYGVLQLHVLHLHALTSLQLTDIQLPRRASPETWQQLSALQHLELAGYWLQLKPAVPHPTP